MAGFSSLLAMTASLYTRYKLCVSSIHRQSEAARKHQAMESWNTLEAKSGWSSKGLSGSWSPESPGTGGTGKGYKEGDQRTNPTSVPFPSMSLLGLSLPI